MSTSKMQEMRAVLLQAQRDLEQFKRDGCDMSTFERNLLRSIQRLLLKGDKR